MAVEIVPYEPAHCGGVRVLNLKLKAGGVTSAYPEHPQGPGILLVGAGPSHELFVAREGDDIRGGYLLKHQRFILHGREEQLGCFQLPVSEGAVDRRYSMVGIQCLRHALARQPLLFTLGIGGHAEPLARLLLGARWTIQTVPFLFRITRPRRFFREIRFLRRTPLRRGLLDVLAVSGLAGLGVRLLQRSGARVEAAFTPIESFGDGADALWARCRADFSLSAVRDRETLSKLYDPQERLLKISLCTAADPAGWAVCLATQLENHKYFGNMKLGTIVDALCLPGHERALFAACTQLLESEQVDLVVSNQAFAPYTQALLKCGFRSGPSNFLFATSPLLTERLQPLEATLAGAHLNRGDGDGPVNL